MAIQKIPMWKENENWRARQQAMRDYMDSLGELTTSMTSAGADRATGMATIMTQAAIKRMKAEAAAKAARTAAASAQAAANEKALQAIKDRMSGYGTAVNVTI